MKQPRFSIHDAFEEENDEAIRVYGSTVVSNIPRTSSGSGAAAASSSSAAAAASGATASAVSSTPNSTGYANNNGTMSNTTANELTCDPRWVQLYVASIDKKDWICLEDFHSVVSSSICSLSMHNMFVCIEIINLVPMTPPHGTVTRWYRSISMYRLPIYTHTVGIIRKFGKIGEPFWLPSHCSSSALCWWRWASFP